MNDIYREHQISVTGQTSIDAFNACFNGVPTTMQIEGAQVGDTVIACNLKFGDTFVLTVTAVDGATATLASTRNA